MDGNFFKLDDPFEKKYFRRKISSNASNQIMCMM
jgi:hypothetical protein